MQPHCRGGMLWHCIVMVLATLAPAQPPLASSIVSDEQQDKVAEKFEKQLGIEAEQRKTEDSNIWVEQLDPADTLYDYGDTGAQLTDTGKPEAPQAVDQYVPEIHPVLPKDHGWKPCEHECMNDEYCWQGQCVYRPWKYHERPKSECYPNPSQPGLSLEEKQRCRAERPRYNKDICNKIKYCEFRQDAPMWYKPFIERWRPPPPEPGTLYDKFVDASKNFAIAAVSDRDVTGAEPLSRYQKRLNAEGKFVGGTNSLPYSERGADDFRNWAGDEEYKPLQPRVIKIKESPAFDATYPSNTTGPRFSENQTDPYWYMRNSLKKKAVADDIQDAAKAKADETAAEKNQPGPAPGPAPAPGPGPAPGPAPAHIASPAFLEIRHIQEHPYV